MPYKRFVSSRVLNGPLLDKSGDNQAALLKFIVDGLNGIFIVETGVKLWNFAPTVVKSAGSANQYGRCTIPANVPRQGALDGYTVQTTLECNCTCASVSQGAFEGFSIILEFQVHELPGRSFQANVGEYHVLASCAQISASLVDVQLLELSQLVGLWKLTDGAWRDPFVFNPGMNDGGGLL
jgi:hypothetical protein